MHCPVCGVYANFQWSQFDINGIYSFDEGTAIETGMGSDLRVSQCPKCRNTVVLERYGLLGFIEGVHHIAGEVSTKIIYPQVEVKPSIALHEEVPEKYRKEFLEAQEVLPISPKSSSAISRRILQLFLKDKCGIKGRNLAEEIDKYLEKENPPSFLGDSLHAVRSFGNISAHATMDKVTCEIIDVEEGEAEWLLEILEMLFDYHFVVPARYKKRIAELNEKLESAGKKPIKGDE